MERKSGVFWQRTGDEGSIPDGRNKSKDLLTCGVTSAGNSKQIGITRAVVLYQGDFATPPDPSPGTFGNVWGHCHIGGGVGGRLPPASSRWNPGLLLVILECTEQPLRTKNYLFQEFRKPALEGQVCMGEWSPI